MSKSKNQELDDLVAQVRSSLHVEGPQGVLIQKFVQVQSAFLQIEGADLSSDAKKKGKGKKKNKGSKENDGEQQEQQNGDGNNGEAAAEEGDEAGGGGGEGKAKRKRNRNKKKNKGEGADADGGDETSAADAVNGTNTKEGGGESKAKKGSNKKKAGGKQTDPPTRPVAELFPNGNFPEGQIMEYADIKYDGRTAKERFGSEVRRG